MDRKLHALEAHESQFESTMKATDDAQIEAFRQRIRARLEGLGEAVVKIINMAMRLAPYGVFGLIFVVTSRFGFALLKPLGLFVITVVVGLFLHTAVNVSIFVQVLSAGSFTTAARALGKSPSTLTRAVAELERQREREGVR